MLELAVEQLAQLLPQVTHVLDYKTKLAAQLRQLELVAPLQVRQPLLQATQLPPLKYFPLAQLVHTLAPEHPAQLVLQATQVEIELTVAE